MPSRLPLLAVLRLRLMVPLLLLLLPRLALLPLLLLIPILLPLPLLPRCLPLRAFPTITPKTDPQLLTQGPQP